MMDARREGLLIVLGVTLVLNAGMRVTAADDPKGTSPSASSAMPQGAVRIPDSVRDPIEEATRAVDRKDWATAVRLFALVLEKEPGLTPLRFNYANALVQFGKPAEAVQELDKAIGPGPTFEELVTAGTILRGGRGDMATSHATLATPYFQ